MLRQMREGQLWEHRAFADEIRQNKDIYWDESLAAEEGQLSWLCVKVDIVGCMLD